MGCRKNEVAFERHISLFLAVTATLVVALAVVAARHCRRLVVAPSWPILRLVLEPLVGLWCWSPRWGGGQSSGNSRSVDRRLAKGPELLRSGLLCILSYREASSLRSILPFGFCFFRTLPRDHRNIEQIERQDGDVEERQQDRTLRHGSVQVEG